MSQVEKLLPLLDDYRAISLLNNVVTIEPLFLSLAATTLLGADAFLVAAVPDSNVGLIALQAVFTILALTASVPLFIGAFINSYIRGETPIE